ncbi:MAG TPA: peroxiredoxin [Flavisolibacter sp.]|jgi:peroxiredoxin|nr:peroxiredoxin [Flavisolibacter sp.]
MPVMVGQPAPDFTLFNSEKQEISLSALRGQTVLLLFFPVAFTSVCTAELCSVRDGLKQYEQLNCVPIGISIDSVFTLERFKAEQHLNFSLVSDFNKEVSKAYDSLYENFAFGMKGVSKRAAFIIDREGVVQYAEVLENAGLQPDFAAIQVKLRELAA